MKNLLTTLISAFIIITSFGQIQTSPTSAPASCDGYASFTDSVAGMQSFSWTTDQSVFIQSDSLNISGLCPGNYLFNYTDGSGSHSIPFTIGVSPCFGTSITASVQVLANANPAQCDGQIELTIGGNGVAPYTVDIYPLATITVTQPTTVITSLCPGTYYTQIVDANGCSTSTAFSILDGCQGLAATVSPTMVSAQGLCDGSATVSVSGGNAPYVYLWSNGATTATISNLCVGYYNVSVSDNLGCTDSTFIYITDPCSIFQVGCSVTQNSNPMLCDGAIFAQTNGGVQPVTYNWSNGATTSTINGLCAGTYTIVATDANGCVSQMSVNLLDSIPGGNGQLMAIVSTTDETVSGNCDGTATINVTSGVGPYHYLHDNGSQFATATGLCAGVHTALVYNDQNDSLFLTYLIADPGNVIFNLPYPDSTIVDSLWGDLVANCSIDYNSVNAAYIYNASLNGFDSVTVTWAIYDSSGVNFITQTYYFGGGNGVYNLSLNVYCPQRSTGNYLRVIDQLYLSPSLSVATENNSQTISIYPNPFAENVSVSIPGASRIYVQLVDLTGRILFSQQVEGELLQLKTPVDLTSGKYLMVIKTDKFTNVQSIVKY